MNNLTLEHIKKGQRITEDFARKAWANFCAETLVKKVNDEESFMIFLVGYEAGLAESGEVVQVLCKELE